MNGSQARPAADNRGVPMKIALPVHQTLTEIQDGLRATRGRKVTYSEVLEHLIAVWDEQGRPLTI